jgi:hypothetical protein
MTRYGRGEVLESSIVARGTPAATRGIPMLAKQHFMFLSISALLSACGGEDVVAYVDATPTINPTGVYSCTIQPIDNYVFCGGPVYTSRLEGDAVAFTVTQSATGIQAGVWKILLDGNASLGSRLDLQYRDTSCSSCSSRRPVSIDFSGVIGTNQISNVDIHFYQSSDVDCSKTYKGTCARN